MGTDAEVKQEECQSSTATDLEQRIIRQVEYYFGNANLCKDKFLQGQIKLDDGWVPLETLLTFKRLKMMSEDPKVICDALKKSTNNLLEISEDSSKIRRNLEKPLPDPESFNDEMGNRTLYVKGFKRTATLDELLDFFKEHKAENINMRHFRAPNRAFKGSCFVTFETLDDCENFLELKGIAYQGTELLREKKKDYIKRKDIYYDNLRQEKEKKLLKKSENAKNDAEDYESKIIPGCLLKFTELTSDVTREDIREPLESYGNIVFTDYFKGNPQGVVRFETGVAAAALEGASTEEDGVRKIQLRTVKATVTLIEGEDEKLYWKNIAVSRANSKLRHSEYNRQNRGRFNKNRNWGKKGRRPNRNDESEDQPANKRFKRNESNGGETNTVKPEPGATQTALEQTAS